jgi:aryl-alcohol dehydrogenase-like predicted oxidoreductase
VKVHQLGNNGPQLTIMGFGAWAIGGPWIYGWGAVDDNESIKAIHRGLDGGINWIDTAAAYGFGHSEEIVGKAIKGIRKNVFIATKCGLVPDGKGDVFRNSKPESIRREVEDSLHRLQVDLIDLYQIHWPDASVPYEDSWATMMQLQEEGKVRYIGVSNYDVPMLERCLKVGPIQSLQSPYSMLTREIEKDILPFCHKHQIGVLAYSPMQSGLLTGRFDIKKLAADDWRRQSSMFQEPTFAKALAVVEELRPIAYKYKKTVGQFAVAWVLTHAAVSCAIVGARNASQVEVNIGSADIEIGEDHLKNIQDILKRFEDSIAR